MARSLVAGLVPLVEKCADKAVDEQKLVNLDPDAVSVLYASDIFAAGSGYQGLASKVEADHAAALRNQGSDELGLQPQLQGTQ